MRMLFLLLPILVLSSCTPKSTEKIQSEDKTNIETEVVEDVVSETQRDSSLQEIVTEEADDESFPVIVEFEKTGCFGACPSFKVQIFSNGRALYQGKANVENMGLFESKVNDSFKFFVFQEAEKIDFFQFRNNYPTDGKDIPDLPKTITYLNDGKNELRVVDSFDAPLSLRNFEKFLQEKMESLYWKKVPAKN